MKAKCVNVLVKFGERKFEGGARGDCQTAASPLLFFRLQVVQGDAREIGNDDVAREFP